MHRDLRLATPVSSCWTMSPILCERFTFTIHLQGTPPGTRTGDQLGSNQSCCQLHQGRVVISGRRGTRTPKRLAPPPVFKTGSSSGRMPSVVFHKLRGLESNQRPPGSEPGVTTSSNYPGSSLSRDTIKSRQARGEGIEPSLPGSKPGGLPLADPRSQGVPCGSRTHLASLEGWNLCRSAKGTC